MSKVCLSLVLLAIAYVVSRAADVGDATSAAPPTGIPLKYDPLEDTSGEEDEEKAEPETNEESSGPLNRVIASPDEKRGADVGDTRPDAPATGIPLIIDPWEDSSEEEDEQEAKAEPETKGQYENPIRRVTTDLCAINNTVKLLEEFHEQGKKTPPDTETLMQSILHDGANKGPFYVRARQSVSTGTKIQKDCFFNVDEDMTKLMFANYDNLENCVKVAKATYEAALKRVDNKIQKTKERLNVLTQIRDNCEDPVLDKTKDCLTPNLPKFLRGTAQIMTSASKAQVTYFKRIAYLTENYKTCAGQANATLYEKLEPLRTAAEQCVQK